MTRIKLTVAATLAATMILGSTIVFASSSSDNDPGTSADQNVSTEQLLKPMRKGGGGGAMHLKK